MDPVSAISIVAAATQFAGQILTVIEFVSSVKEAPMIIQQQLVQIEQLSCITRLIIHSRTFHTKEVEFILRTCIMQMSKIETELRKLLPKKGDRAALAKAVVTALKQKQTEKLFQDLEKHKLSLTLCMHLIDADALRELGVGTKKLADILNDTNNNIKAIVSGVRLLNQGLSDANASLRSIDGNVLAVDMKIAALDGRASTIYDEALRTRKALEELTRQMQQLQTAQTTTKSAVPPPQTFFIIPNRLNPDFIGRQDILARLDDVFLLKSTSCAMSQTAGPPVAVIRGMGGQGKTQIALKYCAMKQKNPFTAIFWIDATSQASCESSLEVIYGNYKACMPHAEGTQARVRTLLEFIGQRSESWLLVFDNYDIPDNYRVRDYLPSSALGAVLVTSRHASTRELTRDGYIELEGLEEDAALDLLYQRSNVSKGDTTVSDARDIVRRLGYHALAITQAASYIAKSRLDLEDFLKEYKQRRDIILKTIPEATEYRRKLGKEKDKEIALNVFTTWELSYKQFPEDSLEVKLLTLFAFYNNQDISELFFRDCTGRLGAELEEIDVSKRFSQETLALIKWTESFKPQGLWNSTRYRDILVELTDASLLQSWELRQNDGLIHATLHPLVKDWIHVRATPHLRACSEIMAWLLLGASLFENYDLGSISFKLSIPHQQEVMRHIETLLSSQAESNQEDTSIIGKNVIIDLHKAMYWCGRFMYRMSRYKACEIISRRAWIYLDENLGRNSRWATNALQPLCLALRESEQYDAARELIKILLEARTEVHGPNHELTIQTGVDLAELEILSGNLPAAEIRLRTLKETAEGVFDGAQIVVDTIHNALGNLLYERGGYQEAEELYRKALRIHLEVYGHENNSTANYIRNIAFCAAKRGKYDEALELLNEILVIRLKLFGPEHPDSIECKDDIEAAQRLQYDDLYDSGLELYNQDRFEEAAENFKKAFAGFTELFGGDHEATIDCREMRDKARKQRYDILYNTGIEFCNQEMFHEAMENFEKALAGYLELLGEEHQYTIEVKEWLDNARDKLEETRTNVGNGEEVGVDGHDSTNGAEVEEAAQAPKDTSEDTLENTRPAEVPRKSVFSANFPQATEVMTPIDGGHAKRHRQ